MGILNSCDDRIRKATSDLRADNERLTAELAKANTRELQHYVNVGRGEPQLVSSEDIDIAERSAKRIFLAGFDAGIESAIDSYWTATSKTDEQAWQQYLKDRTEKFPSNQITICGIPITVIDSQSGDPNELVFIQDGNIVGRIVLERDDQGELYGSNT